MYTKFIGNLFREISNGNYKLVSNQSKLDKIRAYFNRDNIYKLILLLIGNIGLILIAFSGGDGLTNFGHLLWAIISCAVLNVICFLIMFTESDPDITQSLHDTYTDLEKLHLVSYKHIDTFNDYVINKTFYENILKNQVNSDNITHLEYQLLALMTYAKITNNYQVAQYIISHNKKLLTYANAYFQLENLNSEKLSECETDYKRALIEVNKKLVDLLKPNLKLQAQNITDNYPDVLSILPDTVKSKLEEDIYNKVNYHKLSKARY